jgi:DNA-binding protein HU-beta
MKLKKMSCRKGEIALKAVLETHKFEGITLVKLKELNEGIAAACELKPRNVAAVHAETFRGIAAALEKGERVQIPDFGIFTVKEVPGEGGAPAKKVVRFRQREAEPVEEKGKDRKKRVKQKEAGGETAETAEPAEASE